MVWFVDKVIVIITNLLVKDDYGNSSEVISLLYITFLLLLFISLVLLVDYILYKIKR